MLEIEAMPDGVRNLLDNLWQRSVHEGRKIRILEFFDVFIAKEGLAFDRDLNLIPETRTYHSDGEIDEAITKIKSLPSVEAAETIDRCILTKSRGATNYGHFILEMLPRAWIARKHLHVDDWPVLIHRASPDLVRVASQALNTIGIGDGNIIVSGDDPVFVKHIIVVDGLTAHTQYLSPFVLQCFDEISNSLPVGPNKKIYASRGPRSSRDFHDEGVVARKLTEAGYTETFSGVLDFQSQIRMFKGAERVAGVMGAALTNIAFCKPGTQIFCFMPSTACEVLFWMIAQARRLNYYEIRCTEVGPQIGSLPWDRSIQIDPEILASIVSA
ncbi:glycosyltransferase family 61 protein [Methylobacterium variabile]|nr:glycosyltransferase 61 family protein [Methylobacterium variabile]